MNVVDLLPDHPTAPQPNRFEALLPNLMAVSVRRKSNSSGRFDDRFGRKTLEPSDEFFNLAIARVTYQVKMIRH